MDGNDHNGVGDDARGSGEQSADPRTAAPGPQPKPEAQPIPDGPPSGVPADDNGTTGTDDAGVAPDPVATALAQRDEYLDALRRLQAEFENYKKRVAKQQEDQVARAALSLVDTLLPVLDTLDLATEHCGDPESTDGRAIVAVTNQLRDVLVRQGLERIDPVGEVFDPNDHEAVGHLPPDGDDGTAVAGGDPVVAQVMRAGYRWRGTTVRPAMVMVRG